jgi:hypothetical protein
LTPALGDCFFTPQKDDVPRHLWIVVTDPTRSDRVAFVNVSTMPGPENPAPAGAQVAAQEHPAISRPSVIRCDQARTATIAELNTLFGKRLLIGTKPAPSELVKKAQTALGASQHTPLAVKALLEAQGFCSPSRTTTVSSN